MTMDYLKFYGLDKDPFRFIPDPYFFFSSEWHNKALLSLNRLIEHKEGLLVVTGEPGIGKTVTLKVFVEKCRGAYTVAQIVTPCLPPEKFLLAVTEELGIAQPTGGKNEINGVLHEFLLSSAASGKNTIIVVDEAQKLQDGTLEELLLLSCLGSEHGRPVQIVLSGRTELKDRLQQNNLCRLDRRVTAGTELRPLTRLETSEYIGFRLDRSGNKGGVFDEQAKQAIHKLTDGIPRTINLLASRALMAAFTEESRTVGKRHVRQAAAHVFYYPPGREPWALSDKLRRLVGVKVENKPVIVEQNLKTPRPVRRTGRFRSTGFAVAAVGAITAGGMFLLFSRIKPPAFLRQAPAAIAVADHRPGAAGESTAIDAGKRGIIPLSGGLRDLPEFIPRVAPDRSYGEKNPGWELYRGKVTEFRVLRENGAIVKGIQVIDRGGDGVKEEFIKRALQEVAGTTSFIAASSERKEGYRIERGLAGGKIQVIRYSDETGGRLRAFVLKWP